jgi:hypothetical protein
MTAGEVYCQGTLVRVTGEMTRGPRRPPMPFCAGLIIHPETRRACFTAPLLRDFLNQHEDQLRRTFRRLGWRATLPRSVQ